MSNDRTDAELMARALARWDGDRELIDAFVRLLRLAGDRAARHGAVVERRHHNLTERVAAGLPVDGFWTSDRDIDAWQIADALYAFRPWREA